MGKVLIKCQNTPGEYYLAFGKGTTANKAEAYHYDADYARNWVGPEYVEPVEDKVLIRNVTCADGHGYFTGGNGLIEKSKAHRYDRAEAARITRLSPNVIKIEEIEPVQTDAEKIALLEAKVAEYKIVIERNDGLIDSLTRANSYSAERALKAESKLASFPHLMAVAVAEATQTVLRRAA